MSDTEKPIHAPLLPKHWNQRGDEKRIRLAGGPPVDPHTLATLTEWQKRGVSYGVLIDRLTTFAKDIGFDPVLNRISSNNIKVLSPKMPRKTRVITRK